MAKYKSRDRVVDAFIWNKNGDHPDDGPPDKEGKMVRYFRRPDVPGHKTCHRCFRTMHDHGWIDDGEIGQLVCPGDWVATNDKGEMQTYKPKYFERDFEPVEE